MAATTRSSTGGVAGSATSSTGCSRSCCGTLGFQVDLLSCRVFGDGRLGPPFDHLTLLVDGAWLVDVGFGAFALHPLAWGSREDQQDPFGVFRLVGRR